MTVSTFASRSIFIDPFSPSAILFAGIGCARRANQPEHWENGWNQQHSVHHTAAFEQIQGSPRPDFGSTETSSPFLSVQFAISFRKHVAVWRIYWKFVVELMQTNCSLTKAMRPPHRPKPSNRVRPMVRSHRRIPNWRNRRRTCSRRCRAKSINWMPCWRRRRTLNTRWNTRTSRWSRSWQSNGRTRVYRRMPLHPHRNM